METAAGGKSCRQQDGALRESTSWKLQPEGVYIRGLDADSPKNPLDTQCPKDSMKIQKGNVDGVLGFPVVICKLADTTGSAKAEKLPVLTLPRAAAFHPNHRARPQVSVQKHHQGQANTAVWDVSVGHQPSTWDIPAGILPALPGAAHTELWGLHSLFPEGLLLLLAPHVHHLPVLVDLHGVIHEAVHVDEFDALLVGIVEHGRDDGELAHLLLQVLWGEHTQQLVSTTAPQGLQGTDVPEEKDRRRNRRIQKQALDSFIAGVIVN